MPVRSTRRRVLAAAGVLAILALTMTPAVAAAETPAAVRVDKDRIEGLGEFVDGVMAQQLATREVSGAVVTVVYRGKVLFSRGYGHADVARGVAVDPDQTLFRPGSVSKLFTWTALMQQVELGRVRLETDVNEYIDFKIPPYEGKPITVRDLLQHSVGMSDTSNISAPSADKLVPYTAWLKANVPQRLWAPGTEISYSNYGAALAGYIVERVSGQPFPDYVEQHIFGPLGMASTTFREPLPGALAPRMANGYRLVDGKFVADPFEFFSPVMPAGSAAAPGSDMARFMLAMLNDGKLGRAKILSPASVAVLFSNSRANAPHLQGMAHGYLVYRDAGPRLVGHAGNTGDFHSNLIISPETGFGFFVSTTGGPASGPARTELSDAIVGRVFPEAPRARWTGESPAPAVGSYRANRRDYSRPANPARDLKVTAAGAHALITEAEGRKTYWEQIGPNLYEQVTGARAGGPYERLEFYGGDDARLSFASQPYMTWHLVKP